MRVGKKRHFLKTTSSMNVIWNRFVQLNKIKISNIWQSHLHPQKYATQVSQNIICIFYLSREKEKGLLWGNTSTSIKKLSPLYRMRQISTFWRGRTFLIYRSIYWLLAPNDSATLKQSQVSLVRLQTTGERFTMEALLCPRAEFTIAFPSRPLHLVRLGGPQAHVHDRTGF